MRTPNPGPWIQGMFQRQPHWHNSRGQLGTSHRGLQSTKEPRPKSHLWPPNLPWSWLPRSGLAWNSSRRCWLCLCRHAHHRWPIPTTLPREYHQVQQPTSWQSDVDVMSSNTRIIWTLSIWVVTCMWFSVDFKNWHQEDMCLEEIGFNSQHDQGTYMSTQWAQESSLW